jgi:hypothetical protein
MREHDFFSRRPGHRMGCTYEYMYVLDCTYRTAVRALPSDYYTAVVDNAATVDKGATSKGAQGPPS